MVAQKRRSTAHARAPPHTHTHTHNTLMNSWNVQIYVELQKRNVYVDLHGLLSTPLNHIAGYETLIMVRPLALPVSRH
jgi:hypothetical protein